MAVFQGDTNTPRAGHLPSARRHDTGVARSWCAIRGPGDGKAGGVPICKVSQGAIKLITFLGDLPEEKVNSFVRVCDFEYRTTL